MTLDWAAPPPQAFADGLSPAPVRRSDAAAPHAERLVEEAPVCLVFDEELTITLMATPLQAEALALGFCLSEGLIDAAAELTRLEAVPTGAGLSVFIGLPAARRQALQARRRFGLAPGGCGLCGIEDQAALLALAPARERRALQLAPGAIPQALAALAARQPLNAASGGAHAAALVDADGALLAVAEDVSRHCALDKLIGLAAQQGLDLGANWLLLSSRASFELVQKAARVGSPLLAAMSAPTALALRAAQAAGLQLIGFAREGRWSVYGGA